MSILLKVILAMGFVFIAIQFIQPAHNTTAQPAQNDFIKQMSVPADVAVILKAACYDCHSNNTRYPWYANIQPIGWLLAKHIKDGKAVLNFNEYGNYSERRKASKLKGIYNSVKDGSMPLPAYAFIHEDAKLSAGNKAMLLQWTLKAIDSLSQTKRQ